LSQLTEGQKGKVGVLTPRYLHCKRKLKRQLGTRAWDNAWRARRLGLFAIQTMQHFTRREQGLGAHANDIDPADTARQQGR
jgi:hypothetical protein